MSFNIICGSFPLGQPSVLEFIRGHSVWRPSNIGRPGDLRGGHVDSGEIQKGRGVVLWDKWGFGKVEGSISGFFCDFLHPDIGGVFRSFVGIKGIRSDLRRKSRQFKFGFLCALLWDSYNPWPVLLLLEPDWYNVCYTLRFSLNLKKEWSFSTIFYY
jgi:hypothetical protein